MGEPMAPIPVDQWGKDHWSTFAYAECCVVDKGGRPERERMRCDVERHPAHAHPGAMMGGGGGGTRLKDSVYYNHDDWDCIDDAEAAGLLTIDGTGLYPPWDLTEEGWRIALQLHAHKAAGGSFSTFAPTPKD